METCQRTSPPPSSIFSARLTPFSGAPHHHGHCAGPRTGLCAESPAHPQRVDAGPRTPPRAGPVLPGPGTPGIPPEHGTPYALIPCLRARPRSRQPGRRQGRERGSSSGGWGILRRDMFCGGGDRPQPQRRCAGLPVTCLQTERAKADTKT